MSTFVNDTLRSLDAGAKISTDILPHGTDRFIILGAIGNGTEDTQPALIQKYAGLASAIQSYVAKHPRRSSQTAPPVKDAIGVEQLIAAMFEQDSYAMALEQMGLTDQEWSDAISNSWNNPDNPYAAQFSLTELQSVAFGFDWDGLKIKYDKFKQTRWPEPSAPPADTFGVEALMSMMFNSDSYDIAIRNLQMTDDEWSAALTRSWISASNPFASTFTIEELNYVAWGPKWAECKTKYDTFTRAPVTKYRKGDNGNRWLGESAPAYLPAASAPPSDGDFDSLLSDSVNTVEPVSTVASYFGATLHGLPCIMGSVIDANGDGACFFHAARIALGKQGVDPKPNFEAWYCGMRNRWLGLCNGKTHDGITTQFLQLKYAYVDDMQVAGEFDRLFPTFTTRAKWSNRDPVVLQILCRFFGLLLPHKTPGEPLFLDAAEHYADASLERTLVATAFLTDVTRWFIITSNVHFKAVSTRRRDQMNRSDLHNVMASALDVLARMFADPSTTRVNGFVLWLAATFDIGADRVQEWTGRGGRVEAVVTSVEMTNLLYEADNDARIDAALVYFSIKSTGALPDGYAPLGTGAGAGAGGAAAAPAAQAAFTDCTAAPIASRL